MNLNSILLNRNRLDKCVGPHDFSICLNRHSKEKIDGVLTTPLSLSEWSRFGSIWRCSKCGGEVESMDKIWYEKGVQHGKIKAKPEPSEAVKSIDRVAAYNEAQADERFGW